MEWLREGGGMVVGERWWGLELMELMENGSWWIYFCVDTVLLRLKKNYHPGLRDMTTIVLLW
jgi:hypothetical protein